MIITNIFDAIRVCDYIKFIEFLPNSLTNIEKYSGFNLLQMACSNCDHEEIRLQIITKLVSCNIDINFQDKKFKRNALHWLFFNNRNATRNFLIKAAKILLNKNIDINCLDKFGAIPLKYLITIVKLDTEDIEELFKFLIIKGSKYNIKDQFNKSCFDYASEYSWRNGLLKYMEKSNG